MVGRRNIVDNNNKKFHFRVRARRPVSRNKEIRRIQATNAKMEVLSKGRDLIHALEAHLSSIADGTAMRKDVPKIYDQMQEFYSYDKKVKIFLNKEVEEEKS